MLRSQAQTTLLATAARLLVDGVPVGVQRDDVVKAALEVIDAPESDGDPLKEAFTHLEAWSAERSASPFDLLNAVLTLGADRGGWLQAALTPVAQTLRDAIFEHATAPSDAAHFSGDVEEWLALTDYAGDAAATARDLRHTAVETLRSFP